MDENYNKSGQLGGVSASITALVAGVGVAILVLIFVGSLGGSTFTLIEPDLRDIGSGVAVANESFTALKGVAVSLAQDRLTTGVTVMNASTTLTAGNFTVNQDLGTLTLLDNTYNNTALNASYSYRNDTIMNKVNSGIISGFTALENTGKYLPIIVLAVVIVMVLLLVVGGVGKAGANGGAGTAL